MSRPGLHSVMSHTEGIWLAENYITGGTSIRREREEKDEKTGARDVFRNPWRSKNWGWRGKGSLKRQRDKKEKILTWGTKRAVKDEEDWPGTKEERGGEQLNNLGHWGPRGRLHDNRLPERGLWLAEHVLHRHWSTNNLTVWKYETSEQLFSRCAQNWLISGAPWRTVWFLPDPTNLSFWPPNSICFSVSNPGNATDHEMKQKLVFFHFYSLFNNCYVSLT